MSTRAKKPRASPAKRASNGTVKRSVTIREDLDREAHDIVGDRGFSALLNEGLEWALQARRVMRLITEYEEKHGAITDEEGAAALARARTKGRARR